MCFLSLLCSVFIALPSVKCSGGLKTFFFNDLCVFSSQSYTRTIKLGSTLRDYNSSAILKAKEFGFYPTDVTCTVFIEPPLGHGVVVGIRSIDLRPSCADSLTLTDSLDISTTFCGSKSYSQEKLSVYSPGRLTVIFKTGNIFDGGSTASHDGFKLTVTAFKRWPCSSNFEFECSNLRCIAEELKCDGHNHCGDRSDQSRCGIRSVGGTVGVIFGCIFLAVAVIAGTVYYRRKQKTRIVTTTAFPNTQFPQPTHPPYGTIHPPQAPYLQPQGIYGMPPPGYSPPQQGLSQPQPQQGLSQPIPQAFSQPPPPQAFPQLPPQGPTAPPTQY